MVKGILIGIGVLFSLFLLIFILNVFDLGIMKIFGVEKENVRREIFEENKSHVTGMIHDLAEYFKQYNDATDVSTKESIAEVIRIKFAEFDTGKIKNNKLKTFLTTIRGY